MNIFTSLIYFSDTCSKLFTLWLLVLLECNHIKRIEIISGKRRSKQAKFSRSQTNLQTNITRKLSKKIASFALPSPSTTHPILSSHRAHQRTSWRLSKSLLSLPSLLRLLPLCLHPHKVRFHLDFQKMNLFGRRREAHPRRGSTSSASSSILVLPLIVDSILFWCFLWMSNVLFLHISMFGSLTTRA